MKKYKYRLQGLDCANCAKKIEIELAKNNKLQNVVVNFANSTLSFVADEKIDLNKEVFDKVLKIEPSVKISRIDENLKTESIKLRIFGLIFGVLLAIISLYIRNTTYKTICIILAYGMLMLRTLKVAVKKIIKNMLIDESTLICISSIGAYLVNKPMEGMMVLALYELGKILEARAVNKTRKSIESLLNIKPEYANVKRSGKIFKVTPEEVNVGDILVIKSGEKVPLDGVIINGSTQLDNSVITGESKYIDVDELDEVLSGSINVGNVIQIQVTKLYINSTVSRIIELTENATDRKAKTENFVSKLARIYVPIVMILSVIVAMILPMITNVTYGDSIYRALMFLVVSCPCAIAISVPLSYFCGIGKASSSGILIKGSDYLDSLRNIKTICLDKTGTLTTGKFSIHKVVALTQEYSEKEVLKYCRLGESYSTHPIARAILMDNVDKIDQNEVEKHEEITGMGISYVIEGKQVLVGNEKLVNVQDKINNHLTVVYVSINDELIGYVELKDTIKEGVKEAVNNMKKSKLKVKMFTGDNESAAKAVAKEIGIEEVYSKLLPEDKYNKINELIKEEIKEEKVAFVGDGINDSPTIALADVGICMGGVGASSSIEAADVVIMTDDINKVNEAINISRYTNKIIKENLIFALGMKITFLTLSVIGATNMMVAVFADVGVTLITILNSIRILNKK